MNDFRHPNKAPVVFLDRGKRVEADTCLPLQAAAQQGEVRLHAIARGAYPGASMPDACLPGVCSMGFWDAVGKQSWGLDWHRNEGVEFTYVETGCLPFAVKEFEPYCLQAGSLTITRPWQLHRLGDPEVRAGRLHWVILDVDVRRPNQQWRWPEWLMLCEADKRELLQLLSHSEQPVWRASPETQGCFKRLARIVGEGDVRRHVSRMTLHMNELLMSILETLREQATDLDATLTTSQRTVKLFLEEIERHPEHLAYPWSVEEMARQCGLGVTYFVRHCRAVTNNSPARHLNYLRVQRAAHLLREEPRLPLRLIAARCGFANARYLATVFRARFGCTPTEYRLASIEESDVHSPKCGAPQRAHASSSENPERPKCSAGLNSRAADK